MPAVCVTHLPRLLRFTEQHRSSRLQRAQGTRPSDTLHLTFLDLQFTQAMHARLRTGRWRIRPSGADMGDVDCSISVDKVFDVLNLET